MATTTTQRSGGGKGGGGGGGSVTSTTYSYFANFAVGLCEGPIDRIGRIWADGKPLSLAGITMRVYRGTTSQSPDPLIEGVEGSGNAPAYRDTAYVVFDNLALEKFGNRLPQLTFEVFRRVSSTSGDSLETIVRAVTMIPGAGERAYDTNVQKRDLGGGSTTPENDSAGRSTSDWSVALDDLKASLPSVDTVFLVVGWFGDDLRCGSCTKLYAGELASATPDTILSGGTNSLALGTPDGDWEIVQFADAVLTGSQTYRLTKLLRGRLGTEHAIRSPLALGAPVVLLNEAVAKIDGKPAERLAARFYRWGPQALDIADPAWQQTTFATKAVGRMPWSPVQIAGARNGGGDLTITWVRRTRFGGVWADGVDVPLNEESERYEVDVMNGANVVRTFPTTTPTASYSAAQQVADFGSAQSLVSVRVYQLSA